MHVDEPRRAAYDLLYEVGVEDAYANLVVFESKNPNNYTGATADSYQVTSSIDGARTMQLAFRVTW